MEGDFLRHALLPLVLALVGLVFALTGYLVRYRGKHGLIAGFDPSKVTDVRALGRWVGGISILLGGACLLASGSAIVYPQYRVAAGVVLAGVLLSGTVATSVGCSRFTRR